MYNTKAKQFPTVDANARLRKKMSGKIEFFQLYHHKNYVKTINCSSTNI